MRFRLVFERGEGVIFGNCAVQFDPRRATLFVVLMVAPILDEEVLHGLRPGAFRRVFVRQASVQRLRADT